MVAMLSGFFGALALLLAGLGLYGVTSYAVNRRRTEIGIRMALGAAPRGVVGLVLRRVGLLVGIGVLAGSAMRFVSALLYGLQARDVSTWPVRDRAGLNRDAGRVACPRSGRRGSIPASVLRDG